MGGLYSNGALQGLSAGGGGGTGSSGTGWAVVKSHQYAVNMGNNSSAQYAFKPDGTIGFPYANGGYQFCFYLDPNNWGTAPKFRTVVAAITCGAGDGVPVNAAAQTCLRPVTSITNGAIDDNYGAAVAVAQTPVLSQNDAFYGNASASTTLTAGLYILGFRLVGSSASAGATYMSWLQVQI